MTDQDQGVATWNVPISRMEAMMDASDLKSLPVVTIEGGDKVGIVNTILFNTTDYRIQTFLMGAGSWAVQRSSSSW
jgi:sporulation protein YlmC with PRC-barrel domain